LLSELVLNRILSPQLILSSGAMRSEILKDTTPVPIFGNYQDSEIVTVGINPSSNEFPSKLDRKLVHLSDLQLPIDYYQLGLTSMKPEQAHKIDSGLNHYFEKDSANWEWFGHSEKSLNIGFGATYKFNNLNKIACHLDIFPWATKAFSRLSSSLQREFIAENSNFVEKFLSQKEITEVVILGNQALDLLKKQIHISTTRVENGTGPFETKFEFGTFSLGNKSLRYFFTSKGPSARFDNKLGKSFNFDDKNAIHIAFGEFIRKSIN